MHDTTVFLSYHLQIGILYSNYYEHFNMNQVTSILNHEYGKKDNGSKVRITCDNNKYKT